MATKPKKRRAAVRWNQQPDFIEWATRIGMDSAAVHDLLRSATAPPNLVYGHAALQRITSCDNLEIARSATNLLEQAATLPSELRAGFVRSQGAPGKNPLFGYAVTGYPGWALLLCRSATEVDANSSYRRFAEILTSKVLRHQKQTLTEFAYRDYLDHWQFHHESSQQAGSVKSPRSPVPHIGAIQKIELALRRLGGAQHDAAWRWLTQHDDWLYVHGLKLPLDFVRNYPSAAALIETCKHGLGLLPSRARRYSSRATAAEKRRRALVGGVEGRSIAIAGGIVSKGGGSRGTTIQLPPPSLPDIDDEDYPLDEFLDPARSSTHLDPDETELDLPELSLRIQTQWHLQEAQARNQMLAWGRDWLSDHEVRCFWDECAIRIHDRPALEVGRLVSVVLWHASLVTGQARDTLQRHLHIVPVAGERLTQWVTYCLRTKRFLVACNTPMLATPSHDRDDARIDTDNFVCIPDCHAFFERADALLKQLKVDEVAMAALSKRFPERVGAALAGKDPLSAALRKRHITPSRVTHTLPMRVYELSGDLASIALWAEWRPGHSTTLAHYLAPIRETVEQRIETGLASLPNHIPHQHSVSETSQRLRIGAPNFPERIDTQVLVAHYKWKLAKHPGNNLSAIRRYSNAYIAYYYFLLAAALGYRAKIDPSPEIVFDGSKHVAVFRDKDSGGYHRRIVVLPDVFIEQHAGFQRHQRLIRAAFAEQFANHPDLNLFWFEGATVRPCQPQDVALNAEIVWPYRVNALRRRMRTRLFEVGADGEAIDAWMGHWKLGACPWMTGAGFRFAALSELARGPLKEILADDGWTVIPSLLTEGLLW